MNRREGAISLEVQSGLLEINGGRVVGLGRCFCRGENQLQFFEEISRLVRNGVFLFLPFTFDLHEKHSEKAQSRPPTHFQRFCDQGHRPSKVGEKNLFLVTAIGDQSIQAIEFLSKQSILLASVRVILPRRLSLRTRERRG